MRKRAYQVWMVLSIPLLMLGGHVDLLCRDHAARTYATTYLYLSHALLIAVFLYFLGLALFFPKHCGEALVRGYVIAAALFFAAAVLSQWFGVGSFLAAMLRWSFSGRSYMAVLLAAAYYAALSAYAAAANRTKK